MNREVTSLLIAYFHERAAIIDRMGCRFPSPHLKGAGFYQDHVQAPDSNAAQSDTQDIEATLTNL